MSGPVAVRRLEAGTIAWTVFTTAFLWTATMRGLLRPEISSWAVIGLSGSGRSGSFWVFPSLAIVALAGFYLYGRRRCRPAVHALVAAWHGLLALVVASGIAQQGAVASFEGATWGVELPLWVLAAPVVGGFAAATAWVIADRRAGDRRVQAWGAIDRRALVLAILLLPVVVLLFSAGSGFDWLTRLATAATILQWVLLVQAVSHAEPEPSTRHRTAA